MTFQSGDRVELVLIDNALGRLGLRKGAIGIVCNGCECRPGVASFVMWDSGSCCVLNIALRKLPGDDDQFAAGNVSEYFVPRKTGVDA